MFFLIKVRVEGRGFFDLLDLGLAIHQFLVHLLNGGLRLLVLGLIKIDGFIGFVDLSLQVNHVVVHSFYSDFRRSLALFDSADRMVGGREVSLTLMHWALFRIEHFYNFMRSFKLHTLDLLLKCVYHVFELASLAFFLRKGLLRNEQHGVLLNLLHAFC